MPLKHQPPATNFLHDLHDMPQHGCAALREDFQAALPYGEIRRQHAYTSTPLTNCRPRKRTVKEFVISTLKLGSALLAVTHGANPNAILGEERRRQFRIALVPGGGERFYFRSDRVFVGFHLVPPDVSQAVIHHIITSVGEWCDLRAKPLPIVKMDWVEAGATAQAPPSRVLPKVLFNVGSWTQSGSAMRRG